MAFREGVSAAASGARGGPLPVVRDAGSADTGPVLAVYSACIAADPGYLPFLAPGDEAEILGWFRLKPLLAFLVAELDGAVAGVAGLRDAEPGPGAGQPGGRWLEACRLAVHPALRGGHPDPGTHAGMPRRGARGGPPVDALRRELALAPAGTIARLDLVGGCRVRGTCACQRAVLLARPLRERQTRRP